MEGTNVEMIPITPVPGIHAIAFGFKEIIDGWAEKTEELAMDSTWKTNTAGYELYSFVAEANGEALPFSFLFTTSSGDAVPGAKTRMLSDMLRYLNKRCPNIMFTLSDKEPAEITFCRVEIPKSKHQLCYWHGIKYIEERLAEDKPPAAYDPRKAHRVFDFIDPTWAPGVAAVYLDENEDGEGEEEEDVSEDMSVRISGNSIARTVTQSITETVSDVYTTGLRDQGWGSPSSRLAEPPKDQEEYAL
ncbi:hypothetical protein DFH06DRAFT_976502 [Mycena polygramma]|nr:hypothetical protein DFH06DRAFT_976502 [Mycena polygramma]